MSNSLDGIMLHFALKDKKYMLDLSKSVKPEFFHSKFQVFYSMLVDNFKNPKIKDVLSKDALLDYAEKQGLKDSLNLYSKIYDKAVNFQNRNGPLQDSDFGYYLGEFKKRHNRAVIASTSEEINKALDEGADEESLNQMILDSIKTINSINALEVFDEGDIGSDIKNMLEEYYIIEQSPEQYKGVLSGFPSLDERTNGFQGSELIIIVGMEGTGKSTLMMNMGVNAWLGNNRPGRGKIDSSGNNVLYFTLEMPRSNRGEFTSGAYLNKRILSCVSGLEFESIRKGNLDPLQKEELINCCNFIEDFSQHNKFYVVDIPRGATMADIESKYIEINEDIPIDLVIIDYIGIMAGAERDENDWQAQGNVAADMHEFARSYNVPVMTAAQLNRPSGKQSLTKANENLNNTRVARSAMITQNANIVIAIGARDNEEAFPDMPIFLTKMRDGRKGPLTFTKNFACMRVTDGFDVEQDAIGGLDDFENFETQSLDGMVQNASDEFNF